MSKVGLYAVGTLLAMLANEGRLIEAFRLSAPSWNGRSFVEGLVLGR
jgi:hypothetical protein